MNWFTKNVANKFSHNRIEHTISENIAKSITFSFRPDENWLAALTRSYYTRLLVAQLDGKMKKRVLYSLLMSRTLFTYFRFLFILFRIRFVSSSIKLCSNCYCYFQKNYNYSFNFKFSGFLRIIKNWLLCYKSSIQIHFQWYLFDTAVQATLH